MQRFIYEKPIFNYDTFSNKKPCKICGNIALTEYCKTIQSEPNSLTVWTPVCLNCKQENKEEFENLLNRSMFPIDLEKNEKGEVYLVVDSDIISV